MGMSVKGVEQHRLVGRAIGLLLADPALSERERADCERLRRRADLGVERLKRTKQERKQRLRA